MNLNRDIDSLKIIFIKSKGGHMAKLMIILAFILLLTACGISKEDLSTLRPGIELDTGNGDLVETPVVDESPRTSSEFEVPPTWTPGAVVKSQVSAPSEPVATVENAPGSSAEASDSIGASEGLTYEVQPGDTLAEIANQFNVSLEDIAAANSIENLDHIEVGQILTIPG